MRDVAGKVVVLTGAGKGLGRLLALCFARDHAHLALVDIDADALEQASREANAVGGLARPYLCDVADRDAVYALARQVRRDLGPVDVLVNNAGIVAVGDFLEVDDERHRRVIEVNLLAHLWTTRAFLPDMIERGEGHLLVVSSAAGLAAMPGVSSYIASKFGSLGLAESLRMELRKKGLNVPVTIACPYITDTGMFAGVTTSSAARPLDPEKVAALIYKRFKKNRPYLRKPALVAITPLFKSLLPNRAFELLLRVFRLFQSMDTFHGRQV